MEIKRMKKPILLLLSLLLIIGVAVGGTAAVASILTSLAGLPEVETAPKE